MKERFNLKKTVEAIDFIRARKPDASKLFILKLLYLADRKLLVEWGYTITGDCAVAMKKGPVLENTYKLLKSKESHSVVRALTLQDGDVLQEVFQKYGSFTDEALTQYTHSLPECTGVLDVHIRPEDILTAAGKEDLIELYHENIELEQSLCTY